MEDLKAIVNKYKQSGVDDIESLIKVLRKKGANQLQTTKLLVTELQMTLKVAGEKVLNSPTWSEFKNENMNLRNRFLDLFD
jgi:hypothetical protein